MNRGTTVAVQCVIITGFQSADKVIGGESCAEQSFLLCPVHYPSCYCVRVAFDAAEVDVHVCSCRLCQVPSDAVHTEPMRTYADVVYGERCGDAVVFVITVEGDTCVPNQCACGW